MAIGKASDFVVYQAEFLGAMNEILMQAGDAFNAAGAGTIQLINNFHRGDYRKESFFQMISGLVSRRDTTSVSAATDLAVTQDDIARVKINRKIGPVAQTLDAWRKISSDPSEMSVIVGAQTAKAVLLDKLNTVIRAGAAAIRGTNVTLDVTGETTKTVTHTALIRTLALFGDNASAIRAWVMHSKIFFDLLKQAVADNVTNIADGVIRVGNVPAIGKPIIITDSADLVVAGTPDTYYTLGLTEGALTSEDSEEQSVESQLVTGLENLVMRIQGEYAFTIGVKGYTWDTTSGGVNPLDAAVATGTNWDLVAADIKATAGVRLLTQ